MDMRFLALRGLMFAALAGGVGGCSVHDTQPVNPGYGYRVNVQPHAQTGLLGMGPGGDPAAVGELPPAYVESMPPEPLYEQMTDAPGDSAVWIDGYWHWSGYEWVWVSGKWERAQAGYVYVEPSYAYDDNQDAYLYTPGYWSQPDRVPRGWFYRDSGDGRPSRVSPPAGQGWHRRPVASGNPIPPGGGGGYRPPHGHGHGGGGEGTWHPRPPRGPTTNDPGGPSGGGTYYPPPHGGGGVGTSGGGGGGGTSGGGGGETPNPGPTGGGGGVVYVPRPGQGPVGRQPAPSSGASSGGGGGSTHPGSSRDLNWRQPSRFEPTPGGPISRPISAPPPAAPQAPAPAPQAPPPQAPPPPPPNWQPAPPHPTQAPHPPPAPSPHPFSPNKLAPTTTRTP
jgi:hypothetical protein